MVQRAQDTGKARRCIVVAATGGFPVVINLVEEIVRLHALVPVGALEVADGAKAIPPVADRAVTRTSIPGALASFQARRRALELINMGNPLGAWSVAEALHDDENERRWTQVTLWLARFTSSLPIPDGCDIPVLHHKRMALRTALRVELALRAGDIPRAVHGTVAFFEAALWDHLSERIERSPDPKGIASSEPRTVPPRTVTSYFEGETDLTRTGGDPSSTRKRSMVSIGIGFTMPMAVRPLVSQNTFSSATI